MKLICPVIHDRDVFDDYQTSSIYICPTTFYPGRCKTVFVEGTCSQVTLNDSSLSADVLNRTRRNSDEFRIGRAVVVVGVLCCGPILINRCCEEYDQADLRMCPHVCPSQDECSR